MKEEGTRYSTWLSFANNMKYRFYHKNVCSPIYLTYINAKEKFQQCDSLLSRKFVVTMHASFISILYMKLKVAVWFNSISEAKKAGVKPSTSFHEHVAWMTSQWHSVAEMSITCTVSLSILSRLLSWPDKCAASVISLARASPQVPELCSTAAKKCEIYIIECFLCPSRGWDGKWEA